MPVLIFQFVFSLSTFLAMNLSFQEVLQSETLSSKGNFEEKEKNDKQNKQKLLKGCNRN